MIEFKVIKHANERIFQDEVETALNDGFEIERILIETRESWTYMFAFMIRRPNA
jgi:hypothetical protein